MKLTPGADFINILHTAFTPVVPQSVRTQSSCQYLFTLLGSTHVKAVHRTLMKLTPGGEKEKSMWMCVMWQTTDPVRKYT